MYSILFQSLIFLALLGAAACGFMAVNVVSFIVGSLVYCSSSTSNWCVDDGIGFAIVSMIGVLILSGVVLAFSAFFGLLHLGNGCGQENDIVVFPEEEKAFSVGINE